MTEIPAGRLTFTAPGVRVVIDELAETYCVDLEHGVPSLVAARVLDTFLYARGIELMPEDECPAEELPDGYLRMHGALIDGQTMGAVPA